MLHVNYVSIKMRKTILLKDLGKHDEKIGGQGDGGGGGSQGYATQFRLIPDPTISYT